MPVFPATFPATRMRRTRQAEWLRRLVAEARLSVDDLIAAAFVIEGKGKREPIATMPGVARLSIDVLLEEAEELRALGIPAIAVFPVLEAGQRDEKGSAALDPDNLICRAVKALKKSVPELGVICDVALDPFTSHAHDGIVKDGKILNDETVETLVKQALAQAKAGCDVLAPSDMMDGRIGAIRKALDGTGFEDRLILSYAAKYASHYYGPFRDALETRGRLQGDKKTYQMDAANSDEALREVALDIAEGADIVMVKPALPYLDIVRRVKDTFAMPTFAYQVSGEFAMLKEASGNQNNGGWADAGIFLETLICIKRAGADAIITYAAKEAAKALKS